jgi:hypothetical protein
MYRVAEVAACLEVTTDTMYRSYLPAGAPVVRDERGNLWIVGSDFQAWAQAYLEGKKLKNRMGEGQVFCGRCNQVTKMVQPKIVGTDRHGVQRLAGRCGTCSGKVSRYLKRQDEEDGKNGNDAAADQSPKL